MSNKNKIFDKAKEFENEKKFWEASIEYQEVLKKLNENKGGKKDKIFCKSKIRKMNVDTMKGFSELSFDIKIPTDKILKEINFILEMDEISNVLDEIGRNEFLFCPNFKNVKGICKNTRSVIRELANSSTYDDQGNIVQSGDDYDLSWFNTNYTFNQDIVLIFYLYPIFDKMKKDNKLNEICLVDYFDSKEIFTGEFLEILKIALNRFFNEDFVSFLHILVPKFEKVFLDLNQGLGLDINTIATGNQKGKGNNIWMRDITLNERFFDDDSVRKVWGENFCEQIKFTFFSQLGVKLRHKIAHGYSTMNDLNLKNSILVLYLFIVLVNKVKKNNPQPKQPQNNPNPNKK